MVDAQIRPVFQRTRTTEQPIVKVETFDTSANGLSSFEIRPPAGTTWSVNYATETLVGGSTSVGSAQIDFYDGTEWVTFAFKKAGEWVTGATLSVASFGNGPIILTNTKYMRIAFTVGSSQQAVVHILALVEAI